MAAAHVFGIPTCDGPSFQLVSNCVLQNWHVHWHAHVLVTSDILQSCVL